MLTQNEVFTIYLNLDELAKLQSEILKVAADLKYSTREFAKNYPMLLELRQSAATL